MSLIRTLIIDDDADWQRSLSLRVQAHASLELVGVFDSPLLAHSLVAEGKVDLLLLDIEMPEMNGLDFMRHLLKPPMVVFVTSHRDFAVESYETQALDYLVKPFTTPRFMQAIEKVMARWAEKAPLPLSVAEKPFFFIRENSLFVKVETEAILFLRSMENYTQIITPDRTYTTLVSLSTIEESLPASLFQRVHRSYIVNLTKIKSINKTELFIDAYEIPITRSYAETILETLVKSNWIGRA
jgi:DNA-binding LytR/AlgR family response regulator